MGLLKFHMNLSWHLECIIAQNMHFVPHFIQCSWVLSEKLKRWCGEEKKLQILQLHSKLIKPHCKLGVLVTFIELAIGVEKFLVQLYVWITGLDWLDCIFSHCGIVPYCKIPDMMMREMKIRVYNPVRWHVSTCEHVHNENANMVMMQVFYLPCSPP